MAEEYIKRSEVIDYIDKHRKILAGHNEETASKSLGAIIEVISDKACFPSADVAPVVHGQWDDSYDGITPFCSVCGRTHHTIVRTPKYCPNCGAKMDEEEQITGE